MSFAFDDVPDIVANIIGYVPVGIVLGGWGVLRAVAIAGSLSMLAELSQFVMMYRDPSCTDILTNLAGAALGALVSVWWRMRSPTLSIDRWLAVFAALSAFVPVLYVRSTAGVLVNPRGATAPGTLEASWQLDESRGRAVLDTSEHHLVGQFHHEPARIAGVRGQAPVFDGTNYVDFGRSTVLRLAGSMTISAWINSSAYPVDDAAIVSQLSAERGYQLDTTIDEGLRTIGFKLSDACGALMIRYGATPLTLHTWYHVAGVYDAAAQTLEVYLNGKVDNGALRGTVSPTQRSARGAVYVGRRGDSTRFNFSGTVQHVRLYSFALTTSQIALDMRGATVHAPPIGTGTAGPPCAPVSDPEDKDLPFAAAILGVLVAVACVGLWPAASRLLVLVPSMGAGALLLTVTTSTLPAFAPWMLLIVALAGGTSVVVSVQR